MVIAANDMVSFVEKERKVNMQRVLRQLAKIKVFNLNDMKHSSNYNPFHYLRDSTGEINSNNVIKMINVFMTWTIVNKVDKKNADKIVVLKDGIVAEQGAPIELVKKNGIYKHMTDIQIKAAEWKM